MYVIYLEVDGLPFVAELNVLHTHFFHTIHKSSDSSKKISPPLLRAEAQHEISRHCIAQLSLSIAAPRGRGRSLSLSKFGKPISLFSLQLVTFYSAFKGPSSNLLSTVFKGYKLILWLSACVWEPIFSAAIHHCIYMHLQIFWPYKKNPLTTCRFRFWKHYNLDRDAYINLKIRNTIFLFLFLYI